MALLKKLNVQSETQIQSAGMLFRRISWMDVMDAHGVSCVRIYGLIGYRYFGMDEDLAIDSTIRPVGGSFGLNSNIRASDLFDTENQFHGGDLGMETQISHGSFYLKILTKAALGNVPVFCTHLTANLTIDYPREEGSWEAEQLAQIETILGWIGERAGTEQVVFMGDLNTGLEGSGISAELPANYQRLVDAGWKSPFVEQVGTCTYCESNPLVGSAGDDTATVLIDHILFQPTEGTFTSSRILDGDVTLQSAEDGEVVTKLSDHFGVSVTWSR